MGLTPDEVSIRINNRELVNAELSQLGIAEDLHKKTLGLIDRHDKLRHTDWEAYGFEIGLTQDQLEGLVKLINDQTLWQKSVELQKLFATLEVLGVQDYTCYDPQVIRGLDYYTGTVFEATDSKKEFRAILGGGRYDNLVADVGGSPLPGIGFAMGDMVIGLVLQKYGHIPEFPASPAPVLVTVFDEDSHAESLSLASELRLAGLKVSSYPDPVKLQRQLKYADRIAVPVVVILGPDEIASQKVTIKDLLTRTQQTVSRGQVVQAIKEMLASTNPS